MSRPKVYVCYRHWYDDMEIVQVVETERQATRWVLSMKKKTGSSCYDFEEVDFWPVKKI